MKSWAKPTTEQVDRALSLIAMRPQHRRYFFERLARLKNPAWLSPLADKGMFRQAPEPLRDEEGGVAFPFWPESRYLASVAESDPEAVMEVMRGVGSTENISVQRDFLEAALATPARIAKGIVPVAMRWAECRYALGLADRLGELIVHLAAGGESAGAFDLAAELFAVELRKARPEADERWREIRDVRARFDSWQYDEILKRCTPHLVAADAWRTLTMVCDLLTSALGLSYPRGLEGEAADFSYVWRDSISGPGGHGVPDVKNSLVDAVGDAAEAILRDNGAQGLSVLDEIWSRRWPIFMRIELHLLRLFPEVFVDRIIVRLTDRGLFSSLHVQREYLLLLGNSFGSLPADGKKLVLGWIDDGPGPDYSADFRARWELRRLAVIGKELPPERRASYEKLRERHAGTEEPAFAEGWTGPGSPKERDELARMEVGELLRFLRGWRPDPGPCKASPEGLARVLRGVIAGEPQRYASAVEEFTDLHPTYVRAVVSGLREGLKNAGGFAWGPVIGLCEWAVRQPRELDADAMKSEWADSDWGATRHEVAHLLSTGLSAGAIEVPFRFRKRLWSVVEVLLNDPDPTPETEEKYGGSNMCPITLSVNSVRSEALRAAIKYGLWCMRHIKGAEGERPEDSPGLAPMPELARVLERHLNVSRELSVAVRSVYGEWFPQLVLLDSEWIRDRVEMVFPTAAAYRKFLLAGWDTYVIQCPVYNPVAPLLRTQYEAAVARLSGARSQDARLADPREKLSEHLMAMHARGMLDEGAWKTLLNAFWKTAPPAIRGHAIAYIGRSLYGVSGAISKKLEERLRFLWEGRLAEATAASEKARYVEEVSSFGWWFASDKFDPEWSLAQLGAALDVSGGRIEAANRVVERLARECEQYPEDCLDCLANIMRAQGAWAFLGWGDKQKEIIATALRSSDSRLKEKARGVVSDLMARGYMEYRDLLTGSEL